MTNKLKERWLKNHDFETINCACDDALLPSKKITLHSNNLVLPIIFPSALTINWPNKKTNNFLIGKFVPSQRDIVLSDFYILSGMWDFEETNRILLLGCVDFYTCGIGMAMYKVDSNSSIHGPWSYISQLEQFYGVTVL